MCFTVEDELGNVLLEEKDITFTSGAGSYYHFTYKLPEKATGRADWKVMAKLTQGGNVVSEKELKGTVLGNAELATVHVLQDKSRDEAKVTLTVVNNGFLTSQSETVNIAVSEGGKPVAKVEIPELAPGESVDLIEKISVKDNMFVSGVDEYGNPTETMNVYASLGQKVQTDKIIRMTPKEVADTFKSIEKASIAPIEIEGGESVDLDRVVQIESDQFAYDEFTTFENYGIDVKWDVDNESVSEVTSDDLLVGAEKGKTTLHGVIMPTKVTVKSDAAQRPEDPNADGDNTPGTDGEDKENNSSEKKPDTGDESVWKFWLMLITISILCVGCVILYKRKYNR